MALLHVGVGGVSVKGWDAAGTVKICYRASCTLKNCLIFLDARVVSLHIWCPSKPEKHQVHKHYQALHSFEQNKITLECLGRTSVTGICSKCSYSSVLIARVHEGQSQIISAQLHIS